MLTEKQKMLQGLGYHGADPELVAEHRAGQALLAQYNASAADAPDLRRALLQALLGDCGEAVVIRPPFHCDYGRHIRIGARSFVNFNAVFLDCAAITIGSDVQMGPGVQLYTATHPLDADERRSGIESARAIVIGNNVWLGGNAIVLPGIRIGDDAVIGAGSVVTRDVAAGAVVVGNPARPHTAIQKRE